MEIHRYEKAWFAVSLLLIVGFIATVAYGAVGAGIEMVDDEGGTAPATDPRASPNVRAPGVYAADAGAEADYAVHVEAHQFAFVPGTEAPIRVPAGATVTFYVTSTDVVHGFAVVGTNVNTMVIPGQVAKLTVRFDRPGTYGLVCHEYCGAGHHEMAGRLVVVRQSAYEGPSGAVN